MGRSWEAALSPPVATVSRTGALSRVVTAGEMSDGLKWILPFAKTLMVYMRPGTGRLQVRPRVPEAEDVRNMTPRVAEVGPDAFSRDVGRLSAFTLRPQPYDMDRHQQMLVPQTTVTFTSSSYFARRA